MDNLFIALGVLTVAVWFLELVLNHFWFISLLRFGFFTKGKELDIKEVEVENLIAKSKGTNFEKLGFKKLGESIYFRFGLGYLFSNRVSVFLRISTGKIVFDESAQKWMLKLKINWGIWTVILFNFASVFIRYSDFSSQMQFLGMGVIIFSVAFVVLRIFYKKYINSLVDFICQNVS